jgi:hypothetical protein
MKDPKTNEVMAESFTRMLIDGPEVSFNGSPTVSPITAAVCCASVLKTVVVNCLGFLAFLFSCAWSVFS